MSAGHFKECCEVHRDVVVAQCRCPGPKTVRFVACPESCPGRCESLSTEPLDLEAIKHRVTAALAPEGDPWWTQEQLRERMFVVRDQRFISNAPADILALIGEVERLRECLAQTETALNDARLEKSDALILMQQFKNFYDETRRDLTDARDAAGRLAEASAAFWTPTHTTKVPLWRRRPTRTTRWASGI